jgi:hypothetical protein
MKVSELSISVLTQGESSNFLLLAGVSSVLPVRVSAGIHSYEGTDVATMSGGLNHIPDLPCRKSCLPAASAPYTRAGC